MQDPKAELQREGQLARVSAGSLAYVITEAVPRDMGGGLALRPQGPPGLPGSSCPGGSAGWVPTHTWRALHSLKDPSSTEDLEKGPNSLRPHYTLNLHLMESHGVIMPTALSGFKS